jgi:hypothetical protein
LQDGPAGLHCVAQTQTKAYALNRSLGQSVLPKFGGGFAALLLIAARFVTSLALAGI